VQPRLQPATVPGGTALAEIREPALAVARRLTRPEAQGLSCCDSNVAESVQGVEHTATAGNMRPKIAERFVRKNCSFGATRRRRARARARPHARLFDSAFGEMGETSLVAEHKAECEEDVSGMCNFPHKR